MTKEPAQLTREKLADELTRLRSDYEQLRRETKRLGAQTSRLYLVLESLRPENSRRMS